MDPKLMLLDEPTQGMGHEDVELVTQLIKKVAADRTVLMVEHNMSVVARSPTHHRAAVRRSHRRGPYAEVSRNPKVLEAYMGSTDDALEGIGA
jgi:branched-chain amino acid transport system ATP-binding protein